jgi:kynurenine formamidase
MRDVPDTAFAGWEPPGYRVGPDGKVEGARPGEPNNWGRWGADDQLGTANLLTATRAEAAARLVHTGKRFSLALPIDGTPTPGAYRSPPLHLYNFAAGDDVLGTGRGAGRYQVSDDYLVMALQASTQLDGFGHVGADHTLYNGYWAGLVTGTAGARRLGIHKLAGGIVGRSVLLDIARYRGVERLEPGSAIGPDELDGAAAAQGVGLEPGDVLLARTGHLGWWAGADRAERGNAGRAEPGLSARTIPWLHTHDVAMVATDTTACSVVPPEPGDHFLTWHVGALRDLGLLVGELFELDELAADCAADRVYEGLFVAAPLPVVGGSGSPLNPLVLK